MKIKIINGPNLNLLELRDPAYGEMSLENIIQETNKKTIDDKVELSWIQSNSEAEIIEAIQDLIESSFDALIINPGGYSHTSVSIRDALEILKIPKFEVHLTNTHAREEFRHKMLTAGSVDFIMGGLGKDAYYWAIKMLLSKK